MTDKVVDFDSAKSPHDFARKERKLDGLRSRFKGVLDSARPRKARKKRSRRKKR